VFTVQGRVVPAGAAFFKFDPAPFPRMFDAYVN
jgi:hypothetical protein